MAYKELNNVVFCGKNDCRKVYMFDGSDGSDGIRGGDILPCGHRVAHALLDGNLIREGHEAGRMLEWLYNNDAIKPQVFDLIEDHGGKFDEGLNFRVPDSDLTREEKKYDLDAE